MVISTLVMNAFRSGEEVSCTVGGGEVPIEQGHKNDQSEHGDGVVEVLCCDRVGIIELEGEHKEDASDAEEDDRDPPDGDGCPT